MLTRSRGLRLNPQAAILLPAHPELNWDI